MRGGAEEYGHGRISLLSLARALLTRAPVRRWSLAVVYTMLHNPVYVGDIVGGRRELGADRRQVRIRPAAEWYGKRDAHEAIVSRDLFAKVQARLAENQRCGKGVTTSYPLSGLVVCSHCGAPYVGGGGPKKYKFYKCSRGDSRGARGTRGAAHHGTIQLSRAAALSGERDRILALAACFTSIAAQLDGARLRDHLRMWLARATFNKDTRELALAIRRIPAVTSLLPSPLPEPTLSSPL